MTVTVADFCLALHRVSMRGDRDEQGWQGEALWASLEAAERKRGNEKVELPTTLERILALAGGVGVDTSALRVVLTRVPDWQRVLADDWYDGYRREWWGIP